MMVLPEVPKMETSLTKTKLNGHSIIFQIASEFGSWFLLKQSVPSREGWGRSFFSRSTLQCNNIAARFYKNDLQGQSYSDSDSVNRLAVRFPKSCKQPETAAHLFTSQNYK